MRNHSNENEFDLHLNELASKSHINVKACAPGLVLKLRQKALSWDGLHARGGTSTFSGYKKVNTVGLSPGQTAHDSR